MYKLRVLYYFLNHIMSSFRIVVIDFLYKFIFYFCVRTDSAECFSAKFGLVTIAYNNPFVIALQISCVKHFLKDSYCFFVVDNSTMLESRNSIRSICEKASVQYISVPKALRFLADCRKGSYSHGVALNFASEIMLRAGTLRYIGLLDHDVYPFKITSLEQFFKKKAVVAGVIQEKAGILYMWPGFVLFETAFLQSSPVDFRPCTGVDTGGRLYFTHYKKIDKSFLWAVPQHYEELREGDGGHQSCTAEIIGDWIHSVNASYWSACSPKEDDILRFVSHKANWNTLNQEVDYLLSS